MKKIMLIIIGMFLISLTSATIDLGTVKQNECVDLYQSCPTCTYSDVRVIKYPNGTSINIDWSMSKNNSDYTYEFCDTDSLGTYNYITYGNKGGLSYESSETGMFEVTPSGFTGTLGFYILIILLSLGIVVLGYFVEDATVIIFGSFGLIFIGLYFLFNGINGIKDSVYTWGISIIILGLAFYLLAKASQEFLN